MNDERATPRTERRFPSAFRGYDVEAVDRHLAEAEARLNELVEENRRLADRLTAAEREGEGSRREAATLRGELDAMRAAMPEIEELHARLEELRRQYGDRVRAAEVLLAAAAREIAARVGTGPARPAADGPSGQRRLRAVHPREPEEAGEETFAARAADGAPPVGPTEAVRGAWEAPGHESPTG